MDTPRSGERTLIVPGRPSVVSLLVSPEPPPELQRLLVDMRPWCVALADEPTLDPVAYVATSPDAPGLRRKVGGGRPVAVWVRNSAEVDAARALGARVLLTSGDAVLERDDVLRVPSEVAVDVDAITWVPPFVRSRYRRAYALPDELILDLRDTQLGAELLPTALGLCSACVAIGGDLLVALAWGAPAVTDAESAAGLGARAEVEVEIAGTRDPLEVSALLAGDEPRAARLSRGGRRLAEAWCSTARVAPVLADRLGLVPSGADLASARVEAALNRLQTPALSFVRRRARRALIPLTR